MAGISPISGGTTPIGYSGIPKTQPAAGGGKSNFAKTLSDYVSQVDNRQRGAATAIENLVSGRSDGILPAVSAVADADLSFKLLVGVRNKVIEAYKQTMNMQL